MDHSEKNPGIASAKASEESVPEYKTSNLDENNATNDLQPEKKAKPPPLNVNSTEDMLLGVEAGPKTPTSAPYATSEKMMQNRQKIKERKIGHRRVNEEGEITFKKIGTSIIMQSIQLGIGHAVGSLASKPERDLLMMDFTIVETTSFPPDGSNITPAHSFTPFKFKAYAPLAFRYFRDLFGIAPDDFLLSLCNQPMRELNNPGASGSIFYLTSDDEFIIKTVQKGEGEFLQKLLAGYFMNLNQNPRTLLPKFFGLYCYQCGGKNIRLIVMNNLLPSSIKLHEKYDLKGSTYKRKASKSERKKESPTYKDLDFIERHPEGIFLEPDTYNALIKTMQRDCRVLESFKIMDYSLLVAIHNLDAARREQQTSKELEFEEENAQQSSGQFTEKKDSNLARSKSMNKQRLAAFSTAMESIQAEAASSAEDKGDVPPGGIPAKNSRGENLLLFLGIIDILQSYKLAKKLEHTLKSVLHDGDTVSVHRPGFYSNRFMQFMGKTVFKKMPTTLKHSPSKRKGISNKKGYAESKPSNPKIAAGEDEDSKISSEVSKEFLKDENHVEKEKSNLYANKDSVSPKSSSSSTNNVINKTTNVSDKQEVISLSQVTFQTESSECISETSSSSTSGIGSSTLHTVAWTPPQSVESTTPTHTEGTPSFTESSSSGDAVYPTTPVQNNYKSTEFLPPLGVTQTIEGCEVTRL